jgi:CubicO group peptidase (beta-lactamase class C family)
MEHLIEATMHRWMIPGLSLAVVRDGQLVCAAGFGLADRERARPASQTTTYPIASVTKTFVATAIMLLVEEGAIGLERGITEFVPGLPADWRRITLRHLLAHTSGIKDCYVDAGYWYDMAATARDRIDAVARLPLSFSPGSQWEYSNTGYLLLGEVIARVSGRTNESFLADRVFGPLGMTQTRVNDPHEADESRAIGYRRRFDWKRFRMSLVPVNLPHPLIAGSADGGLVSTVVDLAAWDIALSAGRVLRPESLRESWTPTRLTSGDEPLFGLGWALNDLGGRRVVGHSGGDPGFAVCFSRFVKESITVVLCANRGSTYSLAIHDAMFELTGSIAESFLARAG